MIWCTESKKKRTCNECGEVVYDGEGSYSFDEIVLHVERCHLGDGKCMPYFREDFVFDSVDCLERFIPKIREMAGFKIKYRPAAAPA